ncbi:MAG: hypothetical protein FWH06_03090 [Oscillospiraceae bacterium]|nr:hypothetical protein [Oscillospiraceae bacterium]
MADKEKKKKRGEEEPRDGNPDAAETEAEGAKPPKKEKKEKKEKLEKTEKPKKERKSHPVMATLFGVTVFWLVAMLVFTFLTFINAFTLKELVLQFLNPEDTYEVVFASEIDSLLDWETDLENLAKDLDEREDELNRRDSELDDLESALYALQDELEDKFPDWFDEDAQLPLFTTDISSIAKTLAAMEPANAAEMLVELSEDYAVAVLQVMKLTARAAIFDEMPLEERVRLTEAMMAQD